MVRDIEVGKEGSLPSGRSKRLYVGDRRIVVFNDGGIFYAIDDVCTHAGGRLSEGPCEDGVVTCPWHGGRFRLSDGKGLTPPAYRSVRTYGVQLVGGVIRVTVHPD